MKQNRNELIESFKERFCGEDRLDRNNIVWQCVDFYESFYYRGLSFENGFKQTLKDAKKEQKKLFQEIEFNGKKIVDLKTYKLFKKYFKKTLLSFRLSEKVEHAIYSIDRFQNLVQSYDDLKELAEFIDNHYTLPHLDDFPEMMFFWMYPEDCKKAELDNSIKEYTFIDFMFENPEENMLSDMLLIISNHNGSSIKNSLDSNFDNYSAVDFIDIDEDNEKIERTVEEIVEYLKPYTNDKMTDTEKSILFYQVCLHKNSVSDKLQAIELLGL